MKNSLNWKVAGYAGEGIKSTGLMFSKMCLRHGLYTFDYSDYPSLIRGGHNTYQVHASQTPVYSQIYPVDILVALNENAIKFHLAELTPDSILIFDAKDDNIDIFKYSLPCHAYDIPLTQLAKDVGGEALMANNVSLGASAYLLNLDLTLLNAVIKDTFGAKGEAVAALNIKAAEAGFNFVKQNHQPIASIEIKKQAIQHPYSMFGNDALALGAVAGGLQMYAAYPMTPSSSILHTLASWEEKANIMVKHAEDEIGAINMALGASYAGVRSAVGTAGGGFCYMTEAVGLAGIAELPLVIYECQRPGPAVGMPTWTAQGDLLFVLFPSQDEFPTIVVAPGDVDDSFNLSQQAFDLAENLQIPVIVMSDKQLGESSQSCNFTQTEFQHQQTSINPNPLSDQTGFYPRYRVTDSGVSLRSIPGQKNGFYISNGYETDDYGLATEESEPRIQQMDKRFRKLDHYKETIPPQYFDGDHNPTLTIITWGSTKGAVRQALPELRRAGLNVAHLNLTHLWPFPANQVIDIVNRSQNTLLLEGNKTQQLRRLIRMETGLDIYHNRNKYDGRPFYPHEVVQYAHEVLKT